MASYESFTSSVPSETSKKEAELVSKGFRLASGNTWNKPGPGFYVKAESSGSETELFGPGSTTITWQK